MKRVTRSLAERLYADFAMPSRLPSYQRMLDAFLAAGYAFTSVELFAASDDRTPDTRRTVILRHDIDTDPGTAEAMWRIERDRGIAASFFFRLSTVDVPLMQRIAASGSSASYHYEELATVARRRRLRAPEQARAHLEEAREEFLQNIARLRAMTGLPMRLVASHGDFVNRSLGVPNTLLLEDPTFRRSAGIEFEAYDAEVMGRYTSRHSDTLYPRYWVSTSPLAALQARSPRVYILVHPRHWRSAPLVNLRDDVGRLLGGLRYAW